MVALSRDVDDAGVVLPVRCLIHEWFPDAGHLDPAALDGVDGVVHLAGENPGEGPWTAARREAVMRSRVDGTRMIVRAIASRAPEDRPWVFVAASGIGFYGASGDELVTEQSAPGGGYLAEVCSAWEQEARRVEAAGLRWVGIRTGLVLSREGGILPRLLPLFRLGLGGRHGSGRQWVSWIHVEDLVSLYVAALEDRSFEGPVNAVAPHPVTNADFTAALAAALGRRGRMPVPAWLLGALLGERAGIMLVGQRVAAAAATAAGFPFDYPHLESALAELCADLSHQFEQEVWLDRPMEEVFPFLAEVANLPLLVPESANLQLTKVPEGGLGEGREMEMSMRIQGLALKMRSRVEVWDPPRTMVDVQARGPWRSWRHTRELEPLEGGTLVRDRVRYELPLGPLGDLLFGEAVDREVAVLFGYRRMRLLELLG